MALGRPRGGCRVGGRGGRGDEQQRKPGDKGKNPAGRQRFGCSPMEAALRGERGFLSWAYAYTLAHHVQDTAGLPHFLNISGIIVTIFFLLAQEVKGGENESAGVSKRGALLFVTQGAAGTWSCWISLTSVNTRVLELLLQTTPDISASFHSRHRHLWKEGDLSPLIMPSLLAMEAKSNTVSFV